MAEVALRDAVEADVEPLLAIVREPDVFRWWGEETADGIRSEVGILREEWRDPDGVWRDALFMDLLARELR